MPTQFEEIIITADNIDMEQMLPDQGDPILDRGLRWLVTPFDMGTRLDGWQGGPIHLSIGRQWQLLEHDKTARHHVGG